MPTLWSTSNQLVPTQWNTPMIPDYTPRTGVRTTAPPSSDSLGNVAPGQNKRAAGNLNDDLIRPATGVGGQLACRFRRDIAPDEREIPRGEFKNVRAAIDSWSQPPVFVGRRAEAADDYGNRSRRIVRRHSRNSSRAFIASPGPPWPVWTSHTFQPEFAQCQACELHTA